MFGFTAALTRGSLWWKTALAAALLAGLAWMPVAAHASGCTDSWSAKGSGSWFTAANWSTGKVPTSTDEVCITENGTASYTVELKETSGSVEVKSLTLGGSENTQTLAVESSASAHALLITTSGLANGAKGVIVMTNGDGAGNNVTIAGTLTNSGTLDSEKGVGGARTIQGNLDPKSAVKGKRDQNGNGRKT